MVAAFLKKTVIAQKFTINLTLHLAIKVFNVLIYSSSMDFGAVFKMLPNF